MFRYFAAVLMLSGACLAAKGSDCPPQTFIMKPELKGKHPRLFFDKAGQEKIVKRATTTHAWWYKKMQDDFLKETKPKEGALGAKPASSYKELLKWGASQPYNWGNWRLTAWAMFYLVTGEKQYFDCAREWLLAFAGYEDMPGDNLLVMDVLLGLSTTYDWLYDHFTPEEHKKIRNRLYKEVVKQRAFFDKGSYWYHDYQNNHRWNRMMGSLAATMVLYGDDPEYDMQPYADFLVGQINELLHWLPEEGGCHEGPGYWSYGHKFLILGLEAYRNCSGREIYNEHEFFKTSGYYKLYSGTPGWQNKFNWGDGGSGGMGGFMTNLYLLASIHKDGYLQGMLDDVRQKSTQGFWPAQWGLIWYDADLKAKDFTELPLHYFDDDLGLFIIRESWADDAAAFSFKAGYPGGKKLNWLRIHRQPGDKPWVNVAHDHPDQNAFLFFDQGTMLAEDDGYPKKHKITENHNTILVDGQGQAGTSGQWMIPVPDYRAAAVSDLLVRGNCAYIAGDAARSYKHADRVMRHAFFMQGDYVVIYDQLTGAGEKHDFQWRLHNRGAWEKGKANTFVTKDETGELHIKVMAPAKYESQFLPAAREAGPCLALDVKQVPRTEIVTLLVSGDNVKDGYLDKAVTELKDGVRQFSIRDKGGEDIIVLSVAGAPIKTKAVQSDAGMVLVRDKGKGGLLVMGSNLMTLAYHGVTLFEGKDYVNITIVDGKDGRDVILDKPFDAIETYEREFTVHGLKPETAYLLKTAGKEDREEKSDKNGSLTFKIRITRPLQIVKK